MKKYKEFLTPLYIVLSGTGIIGASLLIAMMIVKYQLWVVAIALAFIMQYLVVYFLGKGLNSHL